MGAHHGHAVSIVCATEQLADAASWLVEGDEGNGHDGWDERP
jgi:hypothetical protein